MEKEIITRQQGELRDASIRGMESIEARIKIGRYETQDVRRITHLHRVRLLAHTQRGRGIRRATSWKRWRAERRSLTQVHRG